MAIVTMPTSPNFVRSTFRLRRAIATSVSPFSGKVRSQEFDNVGWEAEVQLPPMKRAVAVEWQAFFLSCKGAVNSFKFADPDALTNTGTFNTTHLIGDKRVNNTNVALTVTNGNTFTAGASTFANAVVGDFIHITGLANDENNGTHKITTRTSNTVVVVDSELTNVSSTNSCKVQQNVKGATTLSLDTTSSYTGTIKKGDYLGIIGSASATGTPVQLLMVVEDATVTDASPDTFSVKTEPKLRSDFADGHYAIFSSPKGLFQMTSPLSEWNANHNSIYSFSFSCIEVI